MHLQEYECSYPFNMLKGCTRWLLKQLGVVLGLVYSLNCTVITNLCASAECAPKVM